MEGNRLSRCCLVFSSPPAPQPQEEAQAGSVVALASLALPSCKFFLKNRSKNFLFQNNEG